MSVKLTHEIFLERMSVINSNIEFIDEYTTCDNKILCKCKIDNNEWLAKPSKLLSGRGCPKCAVQSFMLSEEEFVNRVVTANRNIEVLEKYTGTANTILVKCRICGNEWHAWASGLMNGRGCPKCNHHYTLTNDEFIEKISYVNPNIIVLDRYVNTYTKIRFQCLLDGHIWETRPMNVLSGTGCPKCSGRVPMSNDEFIRRVSELDTNIFPIDQYVNSKTRIRFKCKIDGHIWFAFPQGILHGSGCPICNESKGEKRIRYYLQNNGIGFDAQKEFDGLIGTGGGNLRYDFYISDLNLLIEYQGKQHEVAVDFDGDGKGQEKFEKQQEHDRRKREYAKSHNIDLLEIWYPDYENIETILVEYLGNKLAA